MGGPSDITVLLDGAAAGNRSAVDQLLPLVYDQLRALAQSHLQRENPGHTLQATAIVHEAYLRLVRQEDVSWQSRAHFFAVAAQMIRRLLVDHARGRGAKKRDGGARVTLDSAMAIKSGAVMDLLELDDALATLEQLDARQAQVVTMKFFGGLTAKEVGTVLGVSPRTVEGDWHMAREWLKDQLSAGGQ